MFGYQPPSVPTLPKQVAQAEQNKAWMALCQDPKWNFQARNNEDDYYGNDWETRGDDLKYYVVPAPASELNDALDDGALAPKFVFDADAKDTPSDEGMDTYMQRLISILCGRFVVISRPDALEGEDILSSNGIPKDGVRYWWRYWDNEQNVYQDTMVKFRSSAVLFAHDDGLYQATEIHGFPPGEFNPASRTTTAWTRVSASITQSRKECTDHGSFYDFVWAFIRRGSTNIPLWDANLQNLSRLAGVPAKKECANCANHDEDALLRCSRCKSVHYCKNNSCQREDWPRHKKVMCKFFPKG